MNKLCLAGCVILDQDGRVLLIHRNTPTKVQWETPGGKIEEGEEAESATKREAEEELGIEVEIVKMLGQKDFEENGFIMNYTWFLTKIISGSPKLMEEKYDQMKYFSWEELDNIKTQLSPNAKNLVDAYNAGNFTLEEKRERAQP